MWFFAGAPRADCGPGAIVARAVVHPSTIHRQEFYTFKAFFLRTFFMVDMRHMCVRQEPKLVLLAHPEWGGGRFPKKKVVKGRPPKTSLKGVI